MADSQPAKTPDWADKLAAEIVSDVLDRKGTGRDDLIAARLRAIRAHGEKAGYERCQSILDKHLPGIVAQVAELRAVVVPATATEKA